MSDGPSGAEQKPQSDAASPASPAETFTKMDLDRIVAEQVSKERAKFADYEDLKAKAEGSKSVEQQLADMQAKYAKMERDRLAARIAPVCPCWRTCRASPAT